MAKKARKLKSQKNEPEKKKIELLKDMIVFVAGDSSVKIIDILYGKQNVNEFDIAKKLNLTINQTRNILYKLSDEGIVSFNKKKDKKSGGWYTYFWTLNPGKSFIALKNKLSRDIDNLESSLSIKKTRQFYYCANCGIEMSEEETLYHDFVCPECGEVFQLRDNVQAISSLETKILKLKAVLSEVENELGEIGKKEDATNIRKMKTEARKKKIEREVRKAEKEKEKKREERKQTRKAKKKKPLKKKSPDKKIKKQKAKSKKISGKKIKKKILKIKSKRKIRKIKKSLRFTAG